MDLFGTKFTLTIGTWRFRFVMMLEDTIEEQAPPARTPHHVRAMRNAQHVR
ncbi:MAG: hypothetical protein M3Y18_05725 [Candidatus Eremiobacteraeota bacterium]|nr:hypothetical protein [Candidatus Eremiobacteraeota bacterium]